MIFDPNGPPGENWYFLAYFGIVPLEVDIFVLPMIENRNPTKVSPFSASHRVEIFNGLSGLYGSLTRSLSKVYQRVSTQSRLKIDIIFTIYGFQN